jgi:hypothetical protein
LEPRVGVEPTTCRLRIGCSTTELPRPWLITKDLLACTDLFSVNCHQTAIKILFDLRHGFVQIRRVHNIIPFERGFRQMSRNLHCDSPWNSGPDEIPDAAAAKVMKE